MIAQSSTTSKMLGHAKTVLSNSLKNKYGLEDSSTIDGILKIHGLHKDNFDFIKSIEKVMDARINDISIDSNSNKGEKATEGINQESIAPVKKAIGYDYLFRTMEELYGKDEANRLLGEMLDLSLGLSDSTNILKPYCWAMDASDIVLVGRPFGQLHYGPAKDVSDYIAQLCETVHQIAAHIAGALAVGSFFLDLAHILIYKEKVDLYQLKTSKKIRDMLKKEMRQFVYSVNHLSRSGLESPFTNISVFDKVKLKTLVEDKQANYFHSIDEDSNLVSDGHISYIVDYIMEIQMLFLDFFDAGDPINGGAPFRFPVVTMNLSKKEIDGEEIILDEAFLRDICKREIYRYNIFVSEGSKVASCCRLISDVEMMDYAAQVNSFSGASISLGSHRVCTVNLTRIAIEAHSPDEFYAMMRERIESTAKILKAHKELIQLLEKKGLQPFITKGWINIRRLFSTFGILGLYECVEVYKKKFGNGHDVTGSILTYFNDRVNEMSKEYGIIGNIEQIPGESFAIRLAKADKMIFDEDMIPWTMYSNQFIPLWHQASIWEKMDVDGKYNKLITGGGIVHAQIGEKVTGKQAQIIIRYAVKSGCEHFALNAVYSKCENNHITFGKMNTCPTCAAKVIDYFTRIVGYFTPVSNWQKDRREWEFPKRTFATIEEKESPSETAIEELIDEVNQTT